MTSKSRLNMPTQTPAFLSSLRAAWYRLSVRQRGTVIVSIPAFCLVITMLAWVWSRQARLALRQEIDYTEAVIVSSNELLTTLINAETGVRGYTITDDTRFLQPYKQALAELPGVISNLEQLEQSQTQQTQLQQIEQLAQANIEQFERQIQARTAAPTATDAFNERDLLYQSKSTMDEFRRAVAVFQQAEQEVLSLQRQAVGNLHRTTDLIQWLMAIISGIAYWFAMYLFKQLDRELREHELQLRANKTLIQAITANVVDGVVTLTEQAHIDSFNPAASQMFGYEPEEVMGQNVTVLIADSDLNGHWSSLEEALQLRLGRPLQTLGKRKIGTSFPIEISISSMIDHRLIAIIRDVTERQQIEEKLKARADELARLSAVLAKTNTDLAKRNQELDKFAYVASHDLKAPLRAIASLSEWIEEDLSDQLPEENKHQMHLLRGRVHRLEALINGLLEYSRIGRTQIKVEQINLSELLTDVIDLLDPPSTFQINFALEISTLYGKRVLLSQVFANLISNAIKHHPRSEGHIQISARELGNCYEFAVADDGQGIEPAYHDRIFVIFQTLEARDKAENTGMGLAIVKKIVEDEGGKISVDSEIGKGATFCFTWPKD